VGRNCRSTPRTDKRTKAKRQLISCVCITLWAAADSVWDLQDCPSARPSARGCATLPNYPGISPHVFRHTTAVHLLEAGVEINVIRGNLPWTSELSDTAATSFMVGEVDNGDYAHEVRRTIVRGMGGDLTNSKLSSRLCCDEHERAVLAATNTKMSLRPTSRDLSSRDSSADRYETATSWLNDATNSPQPMMETRVLTVKRSD